MHGEYSRAQFCKLILQASHIATLNKISANGSAKTLLLLERLFNRLERIFCWHIYCFRHPQGVLPNRFASNDYVQCVDSCKKQQKLHEEPG